MTCGQELVRFDKKVLEDKGYDLTTAVIFTNGKKARIEFDVDTKAGKKVGHYE